MFFSYRSGKVWIPQMKTALIAGCTALLLATGAAQDAFTCAWPCNDEQRARAGWPGYADVKPSWMYWPKGPAQTVEQPPPDYDRPYNGTIRLSRVGTVQDLVKQCNRPDKIRLGGCARVVDGECIIFMMPDDYLRALDTNPFDVFRHEIGHCNGWHHPNE